jgi:hypothetical protein
MKKTLISIFAICTILVSLLFLPESSFVKIAFASPDSYGNQINYIEIWQWNVSSYELLINFTSSGGSVRVKGNTVTKFIVGIQFNSTLASSTSQAIQYTKVLMNITDDTTPLAEWNSRELNNTSCSLVSNFYHLTEQGIWNVTGYPISGVTYTCTTRYKGYY